MATTTSTIELDTFTSTSVEPGLSIPATEASRSKTPSLWSQSPTSEGRQVGEGDPDGGAEMFALPPPDKGKDAWRFLAAATIIETTGVFM